MGSNKEFSEKQGIGNQTYSLFLWKIKNLLNFELEYVTTKLMWRLIWINIDS